jgi:transposase
MGKIKQPELTEVQRGHLSKGFHNGTGHCLRMRCRAVPFKAEGLSSAQAVEQTDMSLVSVNARVKRFLSEGFTGLQTRSGRGRKPIMDSTDEDAVRAAIEQD